MKTIFIILGCELETCYLSLFSNYHLKLKKMKALKLTVTIFVIIAMIFITVISFTIMGRIAIVPIIMTIALFTFCIALINFPI